MLTSYKGTTSYYDAMGNPTSFSDYKFTWENGRELATVKDRSTNEQIASYEYNSSGMRISKTTVDDTVYYAYDESNNLIFEKHNNYSMVFHYDGNGVRTHFDYKSASIDASFYYRYNAQGDVIALLDSTGAIIAEYDYTAYGRQIKRTGMVSSMVGNRNPFRYRGYYYDAETDYYYLQSRYYDAYVGRFISADKVMGINNDMATNNLFVYCGNNPVVRADYGGDFWHIVVGAVVGAALGAGVKLISNAIEKKPLGEGVLISALSGAASGALASTGLGVAEMIVGGAAIAITENVATQLTENDGFDNFDVGDMVVDGAFGAAFGAIGGPGNGSKHLTNLGLRATERMIGDSVEEGIKAFSKSGVMAGVGAYGKELYNAGAYYVKNTGRYFNKYRSLKYWTEELTMTAAEAIATSDFAKYRFYVIFGGK